jgi:repressor of nif and glnA expression
LAETALKEMVPVFEAGLSMGNFLAVARSGERLGAFEVPQGQVAFGTVCSVTVNGAS